MKYLSIEDLIEGGYLQEANRRFFHPLGLALETNETYLSIQDHRDDKEGVIFSRPPSYSKYNLIENQILNRMTPRLKALGYWTQDIGEYN